jgi:hypothetical protein
LRRIVDRLPEVGSAGFDAGDAVHKRARAINPAGLAAAAPPFSMKGGCIFCFGRVKVEAIDPWIFAAWIKLPL